MTSPRKKKGKGTASPRGRGRKNVRGKGDSGNTAKKQKIDEEANKEDEKKVVDADVDTTGENKSENEDDGKAHANKSDNDDATNDDENDEDKNEDEKATATKSGNKSMGKSKKQTSEEYSGKFQDDKPYKTLTIQDKVVIKDVVKLVWKTNKFILKKEDFSSYGNGKIMDHLFKRLKRDATTTKDKLYRAKSWNAIEKQLLMDLNQMKNNKVTLYYNVARGK